MHDVAEPTLASAGELLVQVEAFSVNRGELLKLAATPEWAPGKDVAGTVVESREPAAPPGTRVVAHVAGGGWAERVVVPRGSWAALPAGVGSATAAALPLAGLTALRLLRRLGAVAGRSLLVTGASGGVGHYLVELATDAGAEVTALSATAERGRRLRELGARTVTDLAAADRGPAGRYDAGLDSVGGETFTALRRLVRPDGLILWFGQAAAPVTLDFFDWVDGRAGAPVVQFSYAEPSRHGDTDGADLATLVRLVADGRLHPVIGTRRPWDATADVLVDLLGRRITGNAVLTLS